MYDVMHFISSMPWTNVLAGTCSYRLFIAPELAHSTDCLHQCDQIRRNQCNSMKILEMRSYTSMLEFEGNYYF